MCQCADINDLGKCTAARLSLGPRRAGEVARQQENPLCREQQQSSRAAAVGMCCLSNPRCTVGSLPPAADCRRRAKNYRLVPLYMPQIWTAF